MSASSSVMTTSPARFRNTVTGGTTGVEYASTMKAPSGEIDTVWFALSGARRLDPIAASGSWGFRVLLVPGSALLWPLLLPRALAGKGGAA